MADEALDLTSPQFADLLRFLAHHGRLLQKALLSRRPWKNAIENAERIQIVEAREGQLLPIEWCYDGPVSDDKTPLCEHAAQALEAGKCAATCPSGAALASVICPLRFWGLGKTIERRSVPIDPKDDGREIVLYPNATVRRNGIDISRSALLAASSRAERVAPGGTARVAEALRGLTSGRVAVVDGWDDWVAEVRQTSPSILVALPHLERDKALQVIAMEIGVGQLLRTGALERDLHVCGPGNVSGPIVLLLGCSTGLADIPFHSFVVRFGEEGAAIVLCTLAVVLGRQAAPVAEQIIDGLCRRTKTGNACFGDVLLDVKRELVGKGMALALSLVAYGDADWECSASARS